MSNDLTKRISQRLGELNLSAQKASLRVSNNRDFLRNVLRAGEDANPKRETILLIAEALESSATWLLTGHDSENNVANEVTRANITLPYRDSMPRDVPVRGTAAGAMGTTGAFEFTSDTVDYVRRPPGLANASDIYALYVTGESMEPRYHHGDLIFVSPHKPISPNDIIVIQEANTDNGCPQAFIKLFLRRSGSRIMTRQYNPLSNVTFMVKSGTVMHKVLSTNEMLGI